MSEGGLDSVHSDSTEKTKASLLEQLLLERRNLQNLQLIKKEKEKDIESKTQTPSLYLSVNIDALKSQHEDGLRGKTDSVKLAPEFCIPIRADVRLLNWQKLGETVQFDAIMMDPPWQLASSQPSRGVTIAYDQLHDTFIENMDLKAIQTEGFIFIWVINVKYAVTLDLLKKWGYTFIDELIWVKMTVNRRIAKGHGFYLQHAKETCLVGMKGNPKFSQEVLSDIIFSDRRGQSQKPEEIYELIEKLVPDGKYCEIFGRKNNLRDYWVTIGNEL
jgi:mRNA (2'-O-methyladenosine-N6-)-methyltransferase